MKGAVPGLKQMIIEIEKILVEGEIYLLLDNDWKKKIIYFTENEFSSKIMIDGQELLSIVVDE